MPPLSASRRFQPGTFQPSSGLLRGCENFADGSFAALKIIFSVLRQDDRRLLRSLRSVHPHPPHPHRRQQLRRVLQEQALEERSGAQEEGEDDAVGSREEGDAEEDDDADSHEDGLCRIQNGR